MTKPRHPHRVKIICQQKGAPSLRGLFARGWVGHHEPPNLNQIRAVMPKIICMIFLMRIGGAWGLASIAMLIACGAMFLPAQPPPIGDLVDLGGRRLHLHCVGTGSPSVLIENGGGSFSMEWVLVQSLLQKDRRSCSYDRAGYGWSDPGPLDEAIEQVVDDEHLLIRKAGLRTPLVLVCQSLGCLFARAYQRRFPEQISGMVFVDGTSDEEIRMPVNGERKSISTLTREQLPSAFEEYRRSLPVLKAGNAADPPFDRLPPDLQLARHWAFEKLIAQIGWLPDSLATAESWRQEFTALRNERLCQQNPLGSLPLIVLERAKDSTETWHTQQVELAHLSSNGKLSKADGSGHMIHLERPDLVVNAINEVAEKAGKRNKSAAPQAP